MFKFVKNLFNKKLLRFAIIPIILFLIGAINALSLGSPFSFSLLTYPQQLYSPEKPNGNILLKGQHVSGTFIAKDNNLGIVGIKFAKREGVTYDEEDVISFELKDMSSNKILYSNKYRSGLINSKEYFPFGFPKIDNSKNKNYVLTITSTKGNNKNALMLNKNYKNIQTSYIFSKKEILNNPSNVLLFLIKKCSLLFYNPELLLVAIGYFMPLFFYLLFISVSNRKLRNAYSVELFIYLAIIYNILFIEINYTGIVIGLLFIWIFAIIKHRLESNITYAFSFSFFMLSIFAQSLNFLTISKNSADWGYFFLVIGCLQLYQEFYKKPKKLININKLLNIFLKNE